MNNPALRDAVFQAIVFAGLIGCIAGMAIMALGRKLLRREPPRGGDDWGIGA